LNSKNTQFFFREGVWEQVFLLALSYKTLFVMVVTRSGNHLGSSDAPSIPAHASPSPTFEVEEEVEEESFPSSTGATIGSPLTRR